MNLDAALSSSGDILTRWWAMLSWPGVPPYSGGVLDSWPSRVAEGLALCRVEWQAVQAAVSAEYEAARKVRENG